MKKLLFIFLCVCIGTVAVFMMGQNDTSSDSAQTQDYMVSMNENGVFDEAFAASSSWQYTMPSYSPAVPLTDYKELSSLSEVESVMPIYPMFIFDEYNDQQLKINYWQSTKNEKKELFLPLDVSEAYGSEAYISEFRIKPITNEEQFEESYYKNKDNAIIKTFDTNSGIYISNTLYDCLDINETDSHLYIEVDLQIPVVAEMIKNGLTSEGNPVAEYTVTDYDLVTVVLDVEGVIDPSYGGIFCLGIEILLPYSLTEDIYKLVNVTDFVLEENQMYWQPNTYIIRSSSSVIELGKAVDSSIGSNFIKYYDHGLNINGYNYLFKDGETYTQ